MRRTYVLGLAVSIVAIAWVESSATAQMWQKHHHNPAQKGYGCQQKGGGDQESAPEPERGAYVAPPRTGTEVGESSGVGLEGPALHFPSLTLKLPSLHFPCISRFRKGPRMMVESAEAAYVPEVARAEFSQEASQEEKAAANGDQENTPQPESTPTQKGDYSPKQNCPTVPCPTISHGATAATDFARWQQTQAENAALMQRIAELEAMCQKLESRLTFGPASQPAMPNAHSYLPPANPQNAQITIMQQQLAAMQATIERLHQTQQNQAAPQRQIEQVAVYMAGSQTPHRSAATPSAAAAGVVAVAPQTDIRRLPAPRPLPQIDPRMSRLPAASQSNVARRSAS